MTALAMLAATLSLALMAMTTALNLERAATDRRGAQALLQALAEREPGRIGADQGVSGRFHWRSTLDPAPAEAKIANCRLTMTVSADGRDYGLATVRPCPPPIEDGPP